MQTCRVLPPRQCPGGPLQAHGGAGAPAGPQLRQSCIPGSGSGTHRSQSRRGRDHQRTRDADTTGASLETGHVCGGHGQARKTRAQQGGGCWPWGGGTRALAVPAPRSRPHRSRPARGLLSHGSPHSHTRTRPSTPKHTRDHTRTKTHTDPPPTPKAGPASRSRGCAQTLRRGEATDTPGH